MVMLFPLRRIWSSFVIRRPSGVISLCNHKTHQQRETNLFTSAETNVRHSVKLYVQLGDVLEHHVWLKTGQGHKRKWRINSRRTLNEWTRADSERILTKSSKPSKVPTISLSFFITMWIREPIHLSTSSIKTHTHTKPPQYEPLTPS